jgi:two-component system chemotaxis response regulator CheB
VLFESAADIYGERLLGLILTGANQDGAAGLATIGRAGGRTVVQDPDSAAVAYLPQAALQQGPVDFILSPTQLQSVFATWGRQG